MQAADDPLSRSVSTDDELIKEVLDGDSQAFNILVQRYFKMVYASAYARLWDHQAAEDLSQEVFLRAFLAIGELKNPRLFPAWLNRITCNLAYDWKRKRQRASKLLPMVTFDEKINGIIDGNQKGARENMEDEEQNREIHSTIEKLPEDLREIVLLRFMQDMKQKEIAKILGVGVWVVNYKLKTALKIMRKSLEPALHEAVPSFSPSQKSIVRTMAVITAAAAMSAPAKAAVTGAAAGVAKISAVSVSKSGAISAMGGAFSIFKLIPASIAAGGMIMGVKQGVAITITAAIVLGGGYYYQSQKQETREQAVPAKTEGVSSRNPEREEFTGLRTFYTQEVIGEYLKIRQEAESGIDISKTWYNAHCYAIDNEFNSWNLTLNKFYSRNPPEFIGVEADNNVYRLGYGDAPGSARYYFTDRGGIIETYSEKAGPGAKREYLSFLTYDKSLGPIEKLNIFGALKNWGKLNKITDDKFSLQMHNMPGSETLEDFCLLLPPGFEIVKQSEDYFSKKKIGNMDFYVFRKLVPNQQKHIVELEIERKAI